jgi:SPP1 gp7 family putative phage head morphogenesis protein
MPAEEARRKFADKAAVTDETFERLSTAARNAAFRIAKVHSARLIQRAQKIIERSIEQGTSWRDARIALLKEFDTEGIPRPSLAHLRTVFNQNVDTAYNDARREVLDEPEMREAFPYRQYLTVGNGTPGVNGVRATHAALHGLIFRSDDPFWDRFTPPWEWGCRCMIVPVTDNQVKGRRVRDAEYVDKKIRVAGEKRRGIRPHPAFDRRRDLLAGIEGELREALEEMLRERGEQESR